MQSSRYRVSSSNGPLYADCSSSQQPNPVDVGVALSTNLGLLALRDPPSPDRHGTEPSEKPACDDFQRRQWRAEGELSRSRPFVLTEPGSCAPSRAPWWWAPPNLPPRAGGGAYAVSSMY